MYAAFVAAAFAVFVHWYEEPTLRRQFGEEYDAYREAVPAWLPRTGLKEINRRGTGSAGSEH